MQTAIVPVSVYPSTSNTLSIRGVGPVDDSGRPNYLYELQNVQEATPAKPAVAATEDAPAIPAVAATYTTTTLTSGNVAMTVSQWDNWGKTPTDQEYQLNCISANLNLTRIK